MKKHFVNYFSFGVDAEIGYEFDKNRTSNRIGNMAMYGVLGLKTGIEKLQDCKTLGALIESMSEGN